MKQKSNSKGVTAGFTLSEVIISVGLLAIALLAVIGLFTSAIRMQAQSQERAEATYLARQLMDRIRAEPGTVPDAPNSWIGGETTFDPLVGVPAFPPGPYHYQDGYSLDVHLEEFPSRPDMKLVRVVVRWDNNRKNVALETLIREN